MLSCFVAITQQCFVQTLRNSFLDTALRLAQAFLSSRQYIVCLHQLSEMVATFSSSQAMVRDQALIMKAKVVAQQLEEESRKKKEQQRKQEEDQAREKGLVGLSTYSSSSSSSSSTSSTSLTTQSSSSSSSSDLPLLMLKHSESVFLEQFGSARTAIFDAMKIPASHSFVSAVTPSPSVLSVSASSSSSSSVLPPLSRATSLGNVIPSRHPHPYYAAAALWSKLQSQFQEFFMEAMKMEKSYCETEDYQNAQKVFAVSHHMESVFNKMSDLILHRA